MCVVAVAIVEGCGRGCGVGGSRGLGLDRHRQACGASVPAVCVPLRYGPGGGWTILEFGDSASFSVASMPFHLWGEGRRSPPCSVGADHPSPQRQPRVRRGAHASHYRRHGGQREMHLRRAWEGWRVVRPSTGPHERTGGVRGVWVVAAVVGDSW